MYCKTLLNEQLKAFEIDRWSILHGEFRVALIKKDKELNVLSGSILWIESTPGNNSWKTFEKKEKVITFAACLIKT